VLRGERYSKTLERYMVLAYANDTVGATAIMAAFLAKYSGALLRVCAAQEGR
jgi:hypothetical protein